MLHVFLVFLVYQQLFVDSCSDIDCGGYGGGDNDVRF